MDILIKIVTVCLEIITLIGYGFCIALGLMLFKNSVENIIKIIRQRIKLRRTNYIIYENVRNYMVKLDGVRLIVQDRFENYQMSIDEFTDWEVVFNDTVMSNIKILEATEMSGFNKKYKKRVEKGLTY